MYRSDGDDDDDDYDIREGLADVSRACMISYANSDSDGGGMPPDSENEDDFEMHRSIKSQFASSSSTDVDLCGTHPPVGLPVPSDSKSENEFEMLGSIKSQLAFLMNEEEDCAIETLRAISRRFSAYQNFDVEGDVMNNSPGKKKQVTASDNEPSSEILSRSNTCESFPDQGRSFVAVLDSEEVEVDDDSVDVDEDTSSTFPESAQAFVYAIRRNRSYQRFLRRKLGEIEARIKQSEKHKKNVMIVKDFQAYRKRITKQALSQRKDPRIKLISPRKPGPSDSSDSECNDNKKTSPLTLGPLENPCVANYRMALERYPVSVGRRSWSAKENENLAKGLKQQLQETVIREATERSSDLEESIDGINTILEAITNLEITPEMIRQFLPKVNWDQLDIKNRSAAECEARWMSSEDPMINNGPWTAAEDDYIRLTTQKKSSTDWLDIAVSLGTNRTPFQCLTRYQRSLNAGILRREWTPEEDGKLRDAVDLFGEKDWQSVANVIKGRTGTQCSNRWNKSIHPTIETKGKWSSEEEKRLKVSVILFGAKKWPEIAQFVPGRTQSQCREKWETLDPNMKRGKWTKEEDAKLREATRDLETRLRNVVFDTENRYWSKVASHLSGRTRSQCLRRWNKLNPHLVPRRKELKRLQREATVGNFVDRESERPDLVAGSFLALAEISLEPEQALKKKRKAREKKADAEGGSEAFCADTERQPKRRRKGLERCSGDVGRKDNETEGNVKEKKQRRKRKSVAGTPDNSTVTTNCPQVKVGIEKLKPRRKVPAVVSIENKDAPN